MSAVVVLILRILAVLTLYAFVGFAFYLLWRNLRHPAGRSIREHIPRLSLSPVDSADGSERSFEEEVVVGRERGCQFCLVDETVSARHAKLSYHNKQWWVEDLNSTNGTFINLQPVTTPTVLTNDDVLMFGRISVNIRIVPE